MDSKSIVLPLHHKSTQITPGNDSLKFNAVIVMKVLLRAGKVFYEMRKHMTFSILCDGLMGFLHKFRHTLLLTTGSDNKQ